MKVAAQLLYSPMTAIKIQRSLKAFIDDVVLHAMATPLTTYYTLQQQVQANLWWWNQLINVTGGSLNHKKCCTIAYQWKPNKLGILTLSPPDKKDESITLGTDQNPQLILIHLSCQEGTK